jgi:hypothetical protein
MDEVLLNIGSVVEVEHREELEKYIIVGKRVISFKSMKAWDYYSVPYPDGLKKDRDGSDENGFFFNHTDINKIVHVCRVKV